MKNKKQIHVIDFLMILGTLSIILLTISLTEIDLTGMVIGPVLESPEDGFSTSRSVLFSFKHGNDLLIDDNIEFRNPKQFDVEDNLTIALEPGVYYWMVKGTGNKTSEVREFTIKSRVELRLKKTEQGYQVVNAGNVNLNVDIYENKEFVENIILEINKHEDFENVSETKFIGRQDE